MTELEKARLYEEEHWADILPEERPGFHLSPYMGWLNDPNGFSRYKGEYHLFYQYNPYDTRWDSMHWGHVRSADLIRWEYLPAALAPDKDYDKNGCFSGSAIQLPDGRHMLMYTGVNGPKQTQCVAFGDGMDYEKSQRNPVLSPLSIPGGCYQDDFRDPKLWRELDEMYAVAATRDPENGGAAQLFHSVDGERWKWVSLLDASREELGIMWECPDFFPLGEKRVLLVSAAGMNGNMGPLYLEGNHSLALVGSYDIVRRRFEREKVLRMDYGTDFYAPQTLGTRDGRRILMGWVQNPLKSNCKPEGLKWYGTLSIPRELSMADGELIQMPVRELEGYRTKPVICNNFYLNGSLTMRGLSGRQVDMEVRFQPDPDCEGFEVVLAADADHDTRLIWERSTGTLTLDRSRAGMSEEVQQRCSVQVPLRNRTLEMRILLDRTTIEVFVDGGRQVMSSLLYTPVTADGIGFISHGVGLLDVKKYNIVV